MCSTRRNAGEGEQTISGVGGLERRWVKYDPYSRLNQFLIDGTIAGICIAAAYYLRFDGQVPPAAEYQMWVTLPVIILGRGLVHWAWGIYRHVWRYISLWDAFYLELSFITFSTLLLVLRLGLPESLALLRIPLSVIMLEFLLSFHLSLSARVTRRVLYQLQGQRGKKSAERKRLLLLGAGSAGVMTAKSFVGRTQFEIVGFLDDDPKKIGAVISGIRVLGPLDALPTVVGQRRVDEVVVCLARGSRDVLKRIWRLCAQLDIPARIIPELDEIVEGRVHVSRLRDLNVEDLLGRETIDLGKSFEQLTVGYKNRRILVTGAGGSIGSEIARQLSKLEPAELILLDKDENSLYELDCFLRTQALSFAYEVLIADIRDERRMRSILSQRRPEIVFHAAAHKHVPLMEKNPSESILNNVFGTQNVLEHSLACGASLFVLISTDKAVRPASLMGASKRAAELVVQGWASRTSARVTAVRFGNVMGSRGSVIPLFKMQIESGGPITLTDPRVTRYFMTIPEAVHLVFYAGMLKDGSGGIYVLDMGDPLLVSDIARDLIELSGLRPEKDVQIQTVGLRPGEKLHEELAGRGERLVSTAHPKIFSVQSEGSIAPPTLAEGLEALRRAALAESVEEISAVLRRLGIDYKTADENVEPRPAEEDARNSPVRSSAP